MRSPARPYAFENVREMSRFGCRASHDALSACCEGSRYSLYASSSTIRTSAGTEAMNARTASGASQVPVGLFGLATNTMRVRAVSAARIAGRSWPRSRAGIAMPLAPRACVAEDDLLGSHAKTRRERVLERKAVAVRIARHARGSIDDRLPHFGAGAARVFVRRKLHDTVFGQAVIARELVDRFSRHIGRQALDVFGRLGRDLGGRHLGQPLPYFNTGAAGYDPSSLRNGARARNSPSAAATGASSRCPSRSTKNRYSQRPVRAGRDSRRVMLTPCLASGSSSEYTAPGRLCADMTSEVSSRPDRATAWRPSTQKRVELFGSSSICGARTPRP